MFVNLLLILTFYFPEIHLSFMLNVNLMRAFYPLRFGPPFGLFLLNLLFTRFRTDYDLVLFSCWNMELNLRRTLMPTQLGFLPPLPSPRKPTRLALSSAYECTGKHCLIGDKSCHYATHSGLLLSLCDAQQAVTIVPSCLPGLM